MPGKFDRLKALCQKLGYPGICPEALTEIRDVIPEFNQFMDDGRRLFFGDPKKEEDQ